MIVRDDLHTLLDSIPDEKLPAVRDALAELADPLTLALLTAPEDDEPLTDEDRAAIAEGRQDAELGLTTPLDEFLAQRTTDF